MMPLAGPRCRERRGGRVAVSAAAAALRSAPRAQPHYCASERSRNEMSMKREFVINRHGKDYVLYAGLLDEAHQQGLRAIKTQLVQVPSAQNGNVAICIAEF